MTKPVGGTLEMHEHVFVSGHRSHSGMGKDGKWHLTGEHIRHSHHGGSSPHTHPETGPSFYGYCTPKVTNKPEGEPLDLILRTEEENTFELIVTDSALIHGETPIGQTPIAVLGFPAAERMLQGHRLICIVRDERKEIL